jgi:hypothetical protein
MSKTFFATGVSESGQQLPQLSVDPHYRLTMSAAGTDPNAYALDYPGFWPRLATSRWLTPVAIGPDVPGYIAAGLYRYETQLDTNGIFISPNATLEMDMVADNLCDIYLNDIFLQSTARSGVPFSVLTLAIPVAGKMVSGVNMLSIRVINTEGETGLLISRLQLIQ